MFCPARATCRWAFRLLLLGWRVTPARGALPAQPGTADAVPKEIKDQIAAADTPDKLLDIAKAQAAQQSLPGARAAIEMAIKLRPDLLTDAQPQTPRAWHELWFTERAAHSGAETRQG